jgi:hypothetical protein
MEKRAILLQTKATRFKRNLLYKFEKEATSETNHLLFERSKYSKFNDFWKAVGMETKRRTEFNVQVVCDIARSVWSKQDECQHVKGTTVKFNVPRNCKTFETSVGGLFFVELGMYSRNRIAIPIKKLPVNGLNYWEERESYTFVLSENLLKKRLGVDIHKGAAYAFSIKVIIIKKFLELMTPFQHRIRIDEGDGIPSASEVLGSELTVLHQPNETRFVQSQQGRCYASKLDRGGLL